MSLYGDFAETVTTLAATLWPAIPVLWPDSNDRPPDSGMWLQVRWFPGSTENYGMGDEGPSMTRGLGQVTVCENASPGAVARCITLADTIICGVPKGTLFGTGRVYSKPWASSVVVDDDLVMVPVTIPWESGT